MYLHFLSRSATECRQLKSFLMVDTDCPTQTATNHYIDVIMTTMASQITSLTVVYLIVYSTTGHVYWVLCYKHVARYFANHYQQNWSMLLISFVGVITDSYYSDYL